MKNVWCLVSTSLACGILPILNYGILGMMFLLISDVRFDIRNCRGTNRDDSISILPIQTSSFVILESYMINVV